MIRLAHTAIIAATVLPFVAATVAPTPAHAQWRRGYGYHHGGYGGYGGYGHRGYGGGAIVGGALLGLGIGAFLAAPYARPPVVYAAPPAYYAPPPYYAPPAYAYAPPPGYVYAAPPPPAYYPPPGYYGR